MRGLHMSIRKKIWTDPKQRLEAVRIYCDDNAKSRDRSHGWDLEPCHDELYQTALDLFLATYVVLIQEYYMNADGLPHTVVQNQPLWWAANRAYKSRKRLISVSLNHFDRDWRAFRTAAERELRRDPLWEQDPALFEKQRDADYYLCRACCIGHEGFVYYFVYPYEDEWEQALTAHGFELFGTGESAYRDLVPEPGKVGGC